MRSLKLSNRCIWGALFATVLVGCRLDMHDAPRYDTYEASSLFKDGMSARPEVPGTVARGELREGQEGFYTGRNKDGSLVLGLPESMALTAELLNRGKERYEIYCTPCHGYTGDGRGMIVQRGFKQPPTFHNDRLQNIALGHFVGVIKDGYGAMYSYGHAVKPKDRWAISAYIRTLQYSQNAPESVVPQAARKELDEVKSE